MKPGMLFLLFIFTSSFISNVSGQMSNQTYTYLALGDSYTIGEKVPSEENFPSQVWKMLNDDSINLQNPRIIATTGWTTDELEQGIKTADKEEPLLSSYDFVSLLIGVNNQYRGRSPENYRTEFEELLKKSIRFAGNKPGHVVVLSIPDWGVTPFAKERDREQIARQIDEYNRINEEIAKLYHTYYIYVTPGTREAGKDHTLLADDGLHPSGKEYHRWAIQVARYFKSIL